MNALETGDVGREIRAYTRQCASWLWPRPVAKATMHTCVCANHGTRNEEGERLLEMVQGLDLLVVHTGLKKSKHHLITYSGLVKAK